MAAQETNTDCMVIIFVIYVCIHHVYIHACIYICVCVCDHVQSTPVCFSASITLKAYVYVQKQIFTIIFV